MENVYKRLNKADIDSRNQIEVAASEQQQIDNTLNEFIRLFKDKHLS